jgi:hypothetical protein
VNSDVIINNICIHIMRLLLLMFASVSYDYYLYPYGYYSLSAYEVISVLNYYINLYARLNNAIFTI